jgi:ribonuclease VapC
MIAGRTTSEVFDASVILASILQEPGHEEFLDLASGALASTVNIAEARARLSDRGLDRKGIDEAIEYISLSLVSFDAEQAKLSADIRGKTRGAGLSLGDRACLALAMQQNAVAYTADRAWANVDVPVEVKVIR